MRPRSRRSRISPSRRSSRTGRSPTDGPTSPAWSRARATRSSSSSSSSPRPAGRDCEWSSPGLTSWAGRRSRRTTTWPTTTVAGLSTSAAWASTRRRSGRPETVTDLQDDQLWAAVAEPGRRRLLDVLVAPGEATPTMLAKELPFTRQAVSKHLAVLVEAGLVDARRAGREVRYTVRPDRLDAAAQALNAAASRWDRRLAAIKRLAAQAAQGSATAIG